MKKYDITSEKIHAFQWNTGESTKVAIDYLVAEEGDLDDALLSYRADFQGVAA